MDVIHTVDCVPLFYILPLIPRLPRTIYNIAASYFLERHTHTHRSPLPPPSNVVFTMEPVLRRDALKRRPTARIRKNKKPDYMYVDPVTLKPLGAQAHGIQRARALRMPLSKEQITLENVKSVTTLMLLRLRAKTVRATYKRSWECLKNVKPRKFDWTSPEGDGDAVDRQDKLLHYIEQHLPLIEQYGNSIRLSESASKRLAQANRSGGDRHRTWCELNKAIEAELSRREHEVHNSAQAVNSSSAQAQSCQYPLQFAVDVRRIEQELEADDQGVRKPTVKDKLKAAITNAYESNDIAGAKRIQDQLDRKLALERIKRREKKLRKQNIKMCRARMDARPKGFDPNSDNE